ncbi:MAG: hypothetical protein M1818_002489 [Claussenomyces sp. TS43310]|nr:MAG: hypothetical protein M1818_002489 [Claussenomyces sp. TS43310]
MAVKLSQEELLADFERLDSEAKQPSKCAAPILKGYQQILSYWTEYTRRIGNPHIIPTAVWIKSFFKTLVQEHQGTIGARLSIRTLLVYVVRFATAYERAYGLSISRSVVKEVGDWIETDLKNQFGLSRILRAKPMAGGQDLDILLQYLWVQDQHAYKKERSRVQIALYLLILAYTAARPGAVVVSDAYRNSNQAITYRVSYTLSLKEC